MPIITGTNRNNPGLVGAAGADRIDGRAGADGLWGGRGGDALSGGEGGDTLRGGTGNDILYGFGVADARTGSGDILVSRAGTGFQQPIFVTAAPDDPDRLFVVEKTGQIRILDPKTGVAAATPFLDLPDGSIATNGERGLLGLAFHPDYATNGNFFIYVTNAAGDLEVRRYDRATANTADPGSGTVVLTIPHPGQSNHNGGWIDFGPDGYLYVATGDGGGSGDPANNAQDKASLLGKILRIDIDSTENGQYGTPAGNPFDGQASANEIWAFVLRNPWRPSFDRTTGDLYIADVGQDLQEEINWQSASSDGGENYGWVIREGNAVFDPDRPGNPGAGDPSLVGPVRTYQHGDGPDQGFSVTGGYVHRGPSAGMQGVYFYADFVTDQVWSFRMAGGRVVDAANRTAQLQGAGADVDQIASFGEDGRGNLYIVQLDGDILLLRPQAAAGDMADVLYGGDGRDRILGGVGDDRLFGGRGGDTLTGNRDDDRIMGGTGADRMAGGRGADRFVFDDGHGGVGKARRDTIADLRGNDRIDLSPIDAKAGTARDDGFTYIGNAAFTATGQVRAAQVGDDVVVSLNVRGTAAPEMQILLDATRLSAIEAGDFIL